MTPDTSRLDAIQAAIDSLRAYKRAQADSEKKGAARWNLPPGSSRAKVTTANANWARAAEDRDLRRAQAESAVLDLFPHLAKNVPGSSGKG